MRIRSNQLEHHPVKKRPKKVDSSSSKGSRKAVSATKFQVSSKLLWETLNTHSEALDQFEDLSSGAKRDFGTLISELPPDNEESRTQLATLLAEGTLDKKDNSGASTLDNLLRIAGQEIHPDIELQETPIEQIIAQLADPGSIRQGSRDTCSVATVEYLLATQKPAEYSRLAADVFKSDDRIELADGTGVYRPKSSLTADESGRSDLSRLLQSTLMEEVNGAFDYDNQSDEHSLRGIKRPWPGVLSPWAMGSLLTKTMGSKYDTQLRTPKALAAFGIGPEKNLSHVLDDLGPNNSIPVSLAWGNAGHVLLLQGEDKSGNYILRNPWGHAERGQDLSGPFSVQRETLHEGPPSGGLITMKREELERHLLAYWVPQATLSQPPSLD